MYHCVAEMKPNNLEKSFRELDQWLLSYRPLKRSSSKGLRITEVNYFNSGRIETWFISLGSYGQANDQDKSFMELVKWLLRYGTYKR